MIWLEIEDYMINLSLVKRIETIIHVNGNTEEKEYLINFHYSDNDATQIKFTPKHYAYFKKSLRSAMDSKYCTVLSFTKED